MAQTGTLDDIGVRNGCPSTPMITGDWYDGDLEVNPSDNDTIATTGALANGWYFVQMVGYSSVDAIIELVRRDATNTSDVSAQRMAIKSAIGNADLTFSTKVQLEENERFIARMDGSVTGNVQVSINASKIIA